MTAFHIRRSFATCTSTPSKIMSSITQSLRPLASNSHLPYLTQHPPLPFYMSKPSQSYLPQPNRKILLLTLLLLCISSSCNHICIEYTLVCLSMPMYLLHTVEQISNKLRIFLPLVLSPLLGFTSQPVTKYNELNI